MPGEKVSAVARQSTAFHGVEYAAPRRYMKAVRTCVRSAWVGHHHGGGANANLKHCGVSVTEAAPVLAGIQGHEKEVGRREGRSPGCVGVPLGE